MADVYISYSRLDHDRVRPIADRLSSLGYSVWWREHQGRSQALVDEIERELGAARVVLTAWSHNARNATWVYAESARALDENKFLQLRLDNAPLPAPFDAIHVADMSNDRAEWGPLEHKLQGMVRGPDAEQDERSGATAPGLFATPAAAGMPKLLAIASTATLAAFAGAMAATSGGAMTPDQMQVALTGMVGVAGVCAALSAHRLYTLARAGG